MPPTTILVVDDNRHMRRLLLEMLQAAWPGASVLEAADADAAIAQCRDAAPRVVVMDVHLAGRDGIETTALVRLLYPGIAVVICSGHDGRAYRDAANKAGAAAYVGKSEVSTALIPAITAALYGQANVMREGGRA
ncbi:MAG: response regulator [Ramlibacter sp.]